jgi:hypothetical protein
MKAAYVLNKLYKNILRLRYGIGQTKAVFKDYALSKLYTEQCYIEDPQTSTVTPLSKFVGIINDDFSLSSYIGFFDNDDHAMQFGVPVGGDYYLSKINTYGLPFGMRKKVSEPYAED